MAGSDSNGLKWAGAYDDAAGQLFGYAALLHDATSTVARNLTVTGYYYEVAEITNAGGEVTLALPAPILEASCPYIASAAGGARKFPNPNPAFEWIAEQISNIIGNAWPDGDTAKLDEAFIVWHAFADDLDDVASALTSVRHLLTGVDTPELPKVHDAIDRVRTFAKKLAKASRELGKAANDLSGKIAYVHVQTEITVGITIGVIAATVAAALGLTVFTFGISDAVGVAGVAGETAGAAGVIMGFIAEFAATISTAVGGVVATTAGLVGISADLAATIGVAVGDVTATAVMWGYAGAAENTIVTAVTEPGADLSEAAGEGFINWALGGAAGGIVGKTFEFVGANGKVALVESTTDSMGAELGSGSVKPAPLTNAETDAMEDYTGSGFRDVNRALRGDAPTTPELAQKIADLSSGLSKLPDHPGPAFRGTQLTPDQMASYVPGQIREEAAFTSTSALPDRAFDGNTLFIIESRHAKDVAGFSGFPESELLFDKGTFFEVTANFFDPTSGKQVIVMGETG